MTGESFFGRLREAFAPKEQPVPTGEQAWSESGVYATKDFAKYNPDDLIGRKGFGIYRKMMTDEQVKAVVRFKRDAITSREVYFECEHDLPDEERERRVEFFEHVLYSMDGSWRDALNGIMTAMHNGFSMTEKVYAHTEFEGKTQVGLRALKLRPFDTFYFYVDRHGNIEKIEQEYDGTKAKIDPTRFVHFVQNPDIDDHYGSSELREAYRAWFSKDMAIKMQNIYLERMASGFIWAAPVQGKTLTPGSLEYTSLQSALTNIHAKTSLILPSGIELHVERPGDTQAFERAIAIHDKAIAKCLLVPNLLGISEQGNTGSYSQSQTQLEAFFWTLEADSLRLADTLNDQLWWDLGERNFGDGKYPVMKMKPVSESKKLEIIRTWKELVGVKAVTSTEKDEQHLRDMLNMPEYEAPEEDDELPGQPPASGTPSDKQPPPASGDDDQKYIDETVVGKMGITVSAFNRAMKRVDFAVIKSKAEDTTADAAYDVASLIGDAVARMMREAEAMKLGTAEGLPTDAQKIKFSPEELGKIKQAVGSTLKDAWGIGTSHARREMQKAKKQRFATNDLALQDVAANWMRDKAFRITGDLSDAVTKQVQRELVNGIKVSKTFADTKKAIYKILESDGYLTPEDVTEALGTTTVKNTNARVETIMRTNTFEAINEARYNFFSDPELEGFVEALEYSAILDDRTTSICQHLDGHVHPVDSDVWQTYRPPNHFNCRSLLIPVTVRDTWTESDAPTVDPQKGFA